MLRDPDRVRAWTTKADLLDFGVESPLRAARFKSICHGFQCVPDGQAGFVFQKMLAAPARRKGASRPGDKRRGPSFARVSRLVDEGYYDPGNKAIADELEPLIRQFAATA